jgi:lysophospholipase L1-like esterase
MADLPAIEYTPHQVQDGRRIHAQMRRDVEWLLIMGWSLERRADGVHLSDRGQRRIVRGGVMLNG